MDTAKQLRDETLDLFEIHRADYLASARLIARSLYLQHKRPISVDDVRAHYPPPDDFDPRLMGAIFRKPHWIKVGFINSKRRECHGRPVSTFIPSELS